MSEKGPERIGEIVSRLFVARGWGRNQERLRLESAWAAVAGPTHAAQTRVVNIRRNVLKVEVKSTVLLQELTQFHKKRLLVALREALPGVTLADVRFCTGVWKES